MICCQCSGIGFELRDVPSRLYTCGYYRTARVCPRCRGAKHVNPTFAPSPHTDERRDL